MTFYALTLIGNEASAPLERVHIDGVCQQLKIQSEPDWLAEGEACDLFFESERSAKELAELARAALSATTIDAVCTPNKDRRKKILISDMDSTVIQQECIDELGEAFGVGGQIREITTAVINGDIGFPEALRKRLALMKGMRRSLLDGVYNDRITLMPGARTLVQTMRHDGAYCILVSGGFTFFTALIAERIGFHDHQGNDLVFTDDMLNGEVRDPILGRTAKQETLMALCLEKGVQPAEVLAVGDGANDIKMISVAGLGVALHGSRSLKEQANACIDHGDLTALLYIQGFRKSEFIQD